MNNPNWAEQLEAWATLGGAVFAFVGIILAWISIRKQIREQQDNINTLTGVVETLSKQAEALGKQTEALSESMKIDSKILAELTKHFSDTKEMQILQSEKDKINVKPDIRIIGHRSSSSISNSPTNYHYHYRIVNEGSGNARNVRIKTENVSNNFIIADMFRDKLSNDKNDNINLNINSSISGGYFIIHGKLSISYEDIYENPYLVEFILSSNNYQVVVTKVKEEEIIKVENDRHFTKYT